MSAVLGTIIISFVILFFLAFVILAISGNLFVNDKRADPFQRTAVGLTSALIVSVLMDAIRAIWS